MTEIFGFSLLVLLSAELGLSLTRLWFLTIVQTRVADVVRLCACRHFSVPRFLYSGIFHRGGGA